MPEQSASHGDRIEGKRPPRRPWWRISPATTILLAFASGIIGGVAFPGLVGVVAPMGTIWVKAISAVVVPLVVALLITSVASLAGARTVGRIGFRVLIVFLALLVAGAAVVALVTPWMLGALHVTRAANGMLGQVATAVTAPPPLGFWGWIAELVPANPVAAAASGALLPLVVFTVAFAVALTRVPADSRVHVMGFFRGVADVMLEVVRWILWIAPLGVFGLAYALGARTGLGSTQVVLALLVLVAGACLVYICALYALAVIVARVPLMHFARSIAPAQVVAFSSRSSLAALPAMIEAGKERLAMPASITGFVLPLAVSTFKLGATIAITTSTLFLARLYGVPITSAQIIAIAVSAVLLSFSIPGIPAGVLLIMVPVLTSVGIPAEGIGILLAIDVVPDMFRTLTNVTADMVAAAIVTRWMGSDDIAPTNLREHRRATPAHL
ncbi:MAG: dicarboxylate/amino acid:cation symporter [Gemmatimonadaceae bacterium]